MDTLCLLVAGGNEISREGLCALVRAQPGWHLSAEACNGREAVAQTKLFKPHVAIMDMDMPSLNGLDATRQIANAVCQTKVLLLGSMGTEQLLSLALDAGARSYLLKSDPFADLVAAVEGLRYAGSYFTGRAAEAVLRGYLEILEKMRQRDGKDPHRLSGREREVMQLLAEGNSTKEAAVILNISSATAEVHRHNLMRKIDCHSVPGLVRYAIRNHIIEA